jgi:hypothetical protein
LTTYDCDNLSRRLRIEFKELLFNHDRFDRFDRVICEFMSHTCVFIL